MVKTKIKEEVPSVVIRDAIIAGILKAFGITITPGKEFDRTIFYAAGDVQKALDQISSNVPIGSRDALEGIKATRSMIWIMREGR